MNASDTSPGKGKEGSDVRYNYYTVGVELLKQQLEVRAFRLREEFMGLASNIQAGDDPDRSDVRQLRSELEQAQNLVDTIEEGIDEEQW